MAFKGLDRMKKAMDKVQDMQEKDNYKGPTPEEMDRAARMMEANIPPVAPSKLDMVMPTPPEDVKKVKREKTSVEVERKAKGGKVKCMKKGGSVSSASKRADGCATKGKTKGRMI